MHLVPGTKYARNISCYCCYCHLKMEPLTLRFLQTLHKRFSGLNLTKWWRGQNAPPERPSPASVLFPLWESVHLCLDFFFFFCVYYLIYFPKRICDDNVLVFSSCSLTFWMFPGMVQTYKSWGLHSIWVKSYQGVTRRSNSSTSLRTSLGQMGRVASDCTEREGWDGAGQDQRGCDQIITLEAQSLQWIWWAKWCSGEKPPQGTQEERHVGKARVPASQKEKSFQAEGGTKEGEGKEQAPSLSGLWAPPLSPQGPASLMLWKQSFTRTGSLLWLLHSLSQRRLSNLTSQKQGSLCQ